MMHKSFYYIIEGNLYFCEIKLIAGTQRTKNNRKGTKIYC